MGSKNEQIPVSLSSAFFLPTTFSFRTRKTSK